MASEIRVNTINSRTGFGTITVSETGQDLVGITTIENLTAENTLVGAAASFTGNVSVGGVLTYEDVTNIDSVGLITARQGIEIGARPGVAASISVDGNMIVSGISTIANLYVPDKIIHDGDTNTSLRFPTADTITAETGGSERLRIDSSGKICISHTNSLHSGNLQVSTSGADAIDINAYSSTAANGGRLTFYRSKNATIGTNTIVADNDSLGRIDFRGYNSNGNAYNIGATIEAEVDGTVDSTTDMPSALTFGTSAEGSSTPTERFKIATDGNFEIKSPSNATGEQVGKFEWWNENGAGIMSKIACVREADTNAPASLAFYTSANVDTAANSSEGDITEQLRITSAGKLQQRSLGTQTNPARSAQHLYDNGITTDDNYYLQSPSMTTPALVRCVFHDNRGWMIIMQHQCVDCDGLYGSHLENKVGTPNHATSDFQGCAQTDGLNLTPLNMWEAFGRNGEDSRMAMYAREIQTSGGSYDETQTYSGYTGNPIWDQTSFQRLFSGNFSDGEFESSIRVTYNDGASTVYSKKGKTWSSPSLACINNGNVDQDLYFCNGADDGDVNWSFGLMQGGTPYPKSANEANGGGRNSRTRWAIIGICEI